LQIQTQVTPSDIPRGKCKEEFMGRGGGLSSQKIKTKKERKERTGNAFNRITVTFLHRIEQQSPPKGRDPGRDPKGEGRNAPQKLHFMNAAFLKHAREKSKESE